MISTDKNAEFATLFELFEVLATRRSRRTPTTENAFLDDTKTIAVPAELETVFRSLSDIVPPRVPPSGRQRRNTVAALGRTTRPDGDNDSASESDVESIAKFPLGKTYTFTFRMMIHKLYQVDEWANKVREVLQRSKLEYKSLLEPGLEDKQAEPERAATPVADGRVHFKPEVTIGGKKTMPLSQGRQRAYTVAGPSRVAAVPVVSLAAAPSSPSATFQDLDCARAVKKRCIGRRSSMSGAPVGENWFYDAAVSSAEVREREPLRIETAASNPSLLRPRCYSLQGQGGGRKMGFGPRRIVSAIPSTINDVTTDSAPRTATKRRLSE
ncbi:hypothetical protein GGX14DRAFT_351038 [Mycena pura]|uniref:Uncharacterized protein n=1 Tax=Mycena pura TaxID=153505 RepID=A0AAD6YN65_9AGAR|nr:hypothetical protein GGX14DRAFT_351038 [Mycena pura]